MPAYSPNGFTLGVGSLKCGSVTGKMSTIISITDRTILTGIIRDSGGAILPNAGIELYRKASVGLSIGKATYMGTTFTTSTGKYAVSVPMISGDQVYVGKVAGPINSN